MMRQARHLGGRTSIASGWCGGGPLIVDIIAVKPNEQTAMKGIRRCIGIIPKLIRLQGTHTYSTHLIPPTADTPNLMFAWCGYKDPPQCTAVWQCSSTFQVACRSSHMLRRYLPSAAPTTLCPAASRCAGSARIASLNV